MPLQYKQLVQPVSFLWCSPENLSQLVSVQSVQWFNVLTSLARCLAFFS